MSSINKTNNVSYLYVIYRKLFTKEDPQFIHKFFGVLSLLSFCYRYIYAAITTGGLDFDHYTPLDWITMLIHVALSCSSIIFHVLAQRNLKHPMVMYEEYRLHTIIFTLRAFFYFLCGYWLGNASTFDDDNMEYVITLCVYLVCHLTVDKVTQIYGIDGVTTVRVRDDSKKWWVTTGFRLYAFYQLTATATLVVPHRHLGAMGYNTLIAIQSSSFLFTLVRKGLISKYAHMVWYSLCLFLSFYHIYLVFGIWLFFKVAIVAVFRMYYRISKYWLWIGYVALSLPIVQKLTIGIINQSFFVSV